MNKLIIKSALISMACMTTFVYADDLKQGCELKAAKIQRQIEISKSPNVAHLQKALSEVKEHCTDQKLRADLDKKIADKQKKVTQNEAELKKAQTKGDAKKIAKKQQKLANAEQELTRAKQELTEYFKVDSKS